jgi:hypothetical protein
MSEPGVATAMARPKKKGAVGRPKAADPKKSLASIKGGAEYAAWLEGLAEHAHLPLTILIEHALREYAENHGYANPQPKR